MALLSSTRLKKVRLRSRAKIHRCAISTPTSTLALPFGFLGGAGMTTMS
jgi:hypothetical protein